MDDSKTLRAIGVISGTSMDAIDVALLETDGLSQPKRRGGAAYPYPAALRGKLQAVIADAERARNDPLEDIAAEVTAAFRDAIRRFMTERGLGREDIDLVGCHGQTVFHRPEQGITRQLGQGAVLARELGLDVVTAFRQADVAAGGQGAPLVPLYHAALAQGLAQPLVVLNLGGVANITYLDGETILACDTGPASALIDDAMLGLFGLPFDAEGEVAARGHVDAGVLAAMLDDPFFAAPLPKSLDRNDFHRRAEMAAALPPQDRIATLTAFTIAATVRVVDQLPQQPLRWLVTGGGRRNAVFMRGFARSLAVPVEPVEACGWDGDLLEAECFAYLAVRARRGLPLSLPGTTGVARPMPGGEFHAAPA